MVRILLGVAIGIILVPIAVFGWLLVGHVPVATTDKPLPFEGVLTHLPLETRIDREMAKQPPIHADDAALISGARVYNDQCAVCHGYYGKAAPLGANMYPDAPPLWEKHNNGKVVGVSDDPPGETYWKVANGIRLSGMPSFRQTLTESEMWQVTMLLKNADKPLPGGAIEVLSGMQPASNPPITKPGSEPVAQK